MKKTILFYSVFVLSFFIIVPQVYADHPRQKPRIKFAKEVTWVTSAPGETPETTVSALDINGKNLFVMKNGQKVNPIVKFDNTVLTLHYSAPIANIADRQQLVVQLPANLIDGSYDMTVDNGDYKRNFIVTVGSAGPQGPAGTDGAAGTSGTRGLTGLTGSAGANGGTGPRGLTGLTGSAGAAGADSTVVGPTGPAGADSTVAGPTGQRGPAGAAGADSTVAGPKGAKGDKGDAGVTGTNGARGLRGLTGVNGNDGATGSRGPRGVDGAIGASGAQGNTSTKAWVNFNGTGTPVIRAHAGIFKVLRVSTGKYTIQFSTAFANANYVMTATANNGVVFVGTVNTADMNISVRDLAGNLVDATTIMLEFTSR